MCTRPCWPWTCGKNKQRLSLHCSSKYDPCAQDCTQGVREGSTHQSHAIKRGPLGSTRRWGILRPDLIATDFHNHLLGNRHQSQRNSVTMQASSWPVEG